MRGRHVIAILLSAASLIFVAATSAAERPAGWRLASESSPYLQLHADNPVAWFPWGEAALEKARRENKPLFISVGYFTCHWCHVMARESFSDAAIAKLLNDHFVAIKIDREQRPDLDAAYMQYVQLTTGRGGWPMSVWATPDGEPFFGGTYYPPTSTPGQTGFSELLTRLAALWKEDEDSIRATAQQAVALLMKVGRSAQPVELSLAPLEAARLEYRQTYDELQGGFGPAPKFPQPARLLFLLEDTEPASRDMAVHTLARMIDGGIYDQLGGGFHRYSTDFAWRLPHFEKMLYDQALITRACLVAWRETRRPEFARAAREVLDFSLRELGHDGGGFYSALSADSPVAAGADAHMEEGVFYTWTWAQLIAALGKDELLDWAAARYDLFEQGNVAHDPLGEMEGRNVLAEVLGPEQLAARFKVDIATALKRNTQIDDRLLHARAQRPAVPVDDKVVSVWNGYMITTLALAGRLLDEPRYIDAAVRSAEFVLDNLYDRQARILYRDWRAGERGVAGFNEDYVALAEGLLALYRVSAERRWLQQATQLVDRQLELFWDETNGGFFNTTTGPADWLREKGIIDGAAVSDNGMSIHVLLALARLGGQSDYRQRALQTAAWAMGQLFDSPSDMPYALRAWPSLLAKVKNEEGSVTD